MRKAVTQQNPINNIVVARNVISWRSGRNGSQMFFIRFVFGRLIYRDRCNGTENPVFRLWLRANGEV